MLYDWAGEYMDYHLDYGLRLHTEPKYKSLYTWAINEVDADGLLIDRDQIPWAWTLLFSATSCVLTDQIEITAQFSPPRIERDQIIRMTLRPGIRRNGEFVDDVTFSMFGTKRAIRDFTLEIRALDDAAKAERCNAEGSISYTAEIDFRNKTVDDCIWFYLYVKQETFARYGALIDQGAIDTIIFSVGSVDGFYSEWSPSISTDKVKVLLSGTEHKLDLPPDFQGEPPRLGRVRDARLLLHRRLELGKDSLSPPAIHDRASSTPPASSALQVTSEVDLRLLPVLASLKKAAWAAVALLAAIAAIAFLKH
jgi:hypothetical protein